MSSFALEKSIAKLYLADPSQQVAVCAKLVEIDPAADISTFKEEKDSKLSLSAVSEVDSPPVDPVIFPQYQRTGKTLVSSMEILEEFKILVERKPVLAADFEGVDLSRLGRLTVVSIGVQVWSGVQVFIFNMLTDNTALIHAQNSVLKGLLESTAVVKIIHDCRQDSDALKAQFTTSLTNVFDTSIYCMEFDCLNKRTNLNMALKKYGCPENTNKDAISETQPSGAQDR